MLFTKTTVPGFAEEMTSFFKKPGTWTWIAEPTPSRLLANYPMIVARIFTVVVFMARTGISKGPMVRLSCSPLIMFCRNKQRMKYIILSLFTFLMVSCSNSRNALGALKIDPPEGAILEDKVMEHGVHFYSIKWRNKPAQNSVFMISKWPTQMSASKIPSTVKSIIEETLSSLKKRDGNSMSEDAKIQYEDISGKFVSGNLAYIEYTDKKGNKKVVSIHMVSDGNMIWNGQFTGSKELFDLSMDILKTIEPQG